jgi:hypothetical protein
MVVTSIALKCDHPLFLIVTLRFYPSPFPKNPFSRGGTRLVALAALDSHARAQGGAMIDVCRLVAPFAFFAGSLVTRGSIAISFYSSSS